MDISVLEEIGLLVKVIRRSLETPPRQARAGICENHQRVPQVS